MGSRAGGVSPSKFLLASSLLAKLGILHEAGAGWEDLGRSCALVVLSLWIPKALGVGLAAFCQAMDGQGLLGEEQTW